MPAPPNYVGHKPHFHREVSWKQPVRVATTAGGVLASSFEAGDTLDGLTLVVGDRILVKDQANPNENGIYIVNASGAPTRAYDMDAPGEFAGAVVLVLDGTQAGTLWRCENVERVEVDNADVSFVPFASSTGTGHVHVWQEDKSALCDGSKIAFSTAFTFESGTTSVYLNGLHQRPGDDYDEDVDLAGITFADAPLTGDELVVAYVRGVDAEPGTDPVVTGDNPYAADADHDVLLLMQVHCHTNESDGSYSPATVVGYYAGAGYDALVISDHDKITTQPAGVDTAIPGNELSPSTVHLLSVNSTYTRGSTTAPQTMIDGVIAGGGEAIVNHANWSTGITYAEMAALTDYLGMEIFNMHVEDLSNPLSYPGWAVSLWDQVLSGSRTNVWAFATDDLHNVTSRRGYDSGRIKVWAASNSLSNIMAALAAGNFVADIGNFGVTPGWPALTGSDLSVTCTGAVRIEAWGAAGLLDSADADNLTYTFVGDEVYVRLVAIGDYTEAFGSAIDTANRWGVDSGTWSVGSGILSQTSTTDTVQIINLKRHLYGDWEMTVDIRLDASSSNKTAGPVFRVGQYGMHYLRLEEGAGMQLWIKSGSFFSDPAASYSGTVTAETWYRIRYKFTAATSTFQARYWAVGDAEPGTWQIEHVSSLFDHGWIGLYCRGAHDFDNLYIKGFKTFYQPVTVTT